MSDASAARMPQDGHGRLTLRKAYERYYHEWSPDLAASSRARNLYDLSRWERLMGDIPVAELTTEHYQRFRSLTTKSNVCADTCETTLRTIRQIVRVCHAYRLIRVVPDRGKARRIRRDKPHILTLEELARFYEASENRRWPKTTVAAPVWWKALIAVGVWTAFRRQNLFWDLRWEHVLWDTNPPRIEFQATKTGKVHAIPMVPVIVRHLDALKRPLMKASGSIFNTPRNVRDLRGRMRMLSEESHIYPNVTPQTLRRTGICLWRNADSDAGAIIHGQGLPRVLTHYLDQLKILEHTMDDVMLPREFRQFQASPERQLTMF